MGKVISWSDGRSAECELVVVNVTGIAEERGFRLYWSEKGQAEPDRYITPALGLATSHPFRREYQAIAAGERMFGERARRTRS